MNEMDDQGLTEHWWFNSKVFKGFISMGPNTMPFALFVFNELFAASD
jgi:hypothetical protein